MTVASPDAPSRPMPSPQILRRVPIGETTQIGEARRLAQTIAERHGLDDVTVGRIGIFITEAASNIVKHAGKGEILMRGLAEGFECIALDSGRGMADLGRHMRDGYSTAGSSGTGLGAMARLAPFFEIFSQPGKGTAIVARFGQELSTGSLCIGAISVPVAGEVECGDDWAWAEGGDTVTVTVCDGIGHGAQAAEAAAAALEIFAKRHGEAPLEQIGHMHARLHSTRGAALAIAQIDLGLRIVRFAGVGNIAATIFSGLQGRGLPSGNGAVGHQLMKPQQMQYPWPDDALLVMCSDGIQTRWKFEDYPGLRHRHPLLIAAVLYRDFTRGRDDATVLVVRHAD